MNRINFKFVALFITLGVLFSIALTGCNSKTASTNRASSDNGKIVAVGAENEYADIISQIGGKYVSVTAIMSDPNTDPHSYEANTQDASIVSKSTLVVENGLGYDDFIDKLVSGSPNSKREVI
jgi:zinc/manganese transport system substrate-binding protein